MSNIPRSDADTYANLKLATAAGENELNFGYLRMLFEYLIFLLFFFYVCAICRPHWKTDDGKFDRKNAWRIFASFDSYLAIT